jgi:CheY-like chemotaxis protein
MAAGAATTGTVLIAEDEILLALWVEDLVSELGCRIVGPAARLDDLLQLIEDFEVDVALLDVALAHGERVYPAVDLLRSRGIPFAFMTAYDAAGLDRAYAMETILRKPYSASDLRHCVRKLLERKRSGERLPRRGRSTSRSEVARPGMPAR